LRNLNISEYGADSRITLEEHDNYDSCKRFLYERFGIMDEDIVTIEQLFRNHDEQFGEIYSPIFDKLNEDC